MKTLSEKGIGVVDGQTTGANELIDQQQPYTAIITIRGTADLLLNRFNEEEYTEKAASKKGSSVKKTDVPENRVYRNREGEVCLPGLYLTNSIVAAGKYKTDPRNARQSMMQLVKAVLIPDEDLCPVISVTGETTKEGWDYLDRRGANIQRSRIVRVRPAFFKGWTCQFVVTVLEPEYIAPDLLQELAGYAGRFGGLGDFRPTYGRFQVIAFEVRE